MALDTPTVNTFWSVAGSATATSGSFTPPANAVLVLCVDSQQASTDRDTRISSVTSSGYTWTRRAQCSWTGSASVSLPAGTTAQAGTGAEIWTTTTGASPAAMTIAVAFTSYDSASELKCQVEMHTDSSGSVPVVGAVGVASSGSANVASKTITVAAGSYVVATRADWADVGTATFGTSPAQTAIFNNTDPQFSFAAWRTTSTTSAGSLTMSAAASPNTAMQNYNMAVLEVQAPAGGGSSPGSVTAVPATASAAGQVPTLQANSTVVPPNATASAAAPIPGITTGLPVTAVPATASAAGVVPTYTAASNVAGTVATASAAAPVPGLQGGSPVTAPVATASAAAPVPTVSGAVALGAPSGASNAASTAPAVSGGYSCTPPPATASAAAVAPQVGNIAQVNPPPATASAAAAVPDIAGAFTYTVTASASAAAPTPVISGADSAVAVPATASAAAPVPTVTGGTGSSGGMVTAVPATASAVAAVPDVAGNDAVFSVAATANAFGFPPVISGGTAPVIAVPAIASGTAAPPGVAGLGSVACPPATATASAAVPGVAGGGNTPGNVTAVAAVASAGAPAPYVVSRQPQYFVGYGGLLDLQHQDSRNVYTVNITDLSGNPAIVYFDQARTQMVPLPYTFNGVGEHLFYFAEDFRGWLSVLKNGEEIAAQPDSAGQLPLFIRSEETFGYSPSRDLI